MSRGSCHGLQREGKATGWSQVWGSRDTQGTESGCTRDTEQALWDVRPKQGAGLN